MLLFSKFSNGTGPQNCAKPRDGTHMRKKQPCDRQRPVWPFGRGVRSSSRNKPTSFQQHLRETAYHLTA